MNAGDVLQALNQRPFRPFRFVLTNGREIPVLNHDSVLLNQPRTTLLTVEGERFHVVDLQHIAQLTFGGQPSEEELAR